MICPVIMIFNDWPICLSPPPRRFTGRFSTTDKRTVSCSSSSSASERLRHVPVQSTQRNEPCIRTKKGVVQVLASWCRRHKRLRNRPPAAARHDSKIGGTLSKVVPFSKNRCSMGYRSCRIRESTRPDKAWWRDSVRRGRAIRRLSSSPRSPDGGRPGAAANAAAPQLIPQNRPSLVERSRCHLHTVLVLDPNDFVDDVDVEHIGNEAGTNSLNRMFSRLQVFPFFR